jgi:catechol 2,3-dioxygenase-like lactoylglutathione lyase family enzyme
VPGGIHHSVVVVRDLDASLRFYRDGIGLDLLQDRHVEGDWPDLFAHVPHSSPSPWLSPFPRDLDVWRSIIQTVLDVAGHRHSCRKSRTGYPPRRVSCGAALEQRYLDATDQLTERLLTISERGRPAFEFLALRLEAIERAVDLRLL